MVERVPALVAAGGMPEEEEEFACNVVGDWVEKIVESQAAEAGTLISDWEIDYMV